MNTPILENTPCYVTCFLPGSSGSFFNGLLRHFVLPDRTGFQAGSMNHYHSSLNESDNNWEDGWNAIGYPNGKRPMLHFMNSFMAYVDPKDTSLPILFHVHNMPSWQHFFQRWPLGKVFIISYDEDDEIKFRFNMWMKVLVQEFIDQTTTPNPEFHKWVDEWYAIKDKFPDIFSKYEKPQDVSVDDIKAYLESTPHFFKYQNPHSIYKGYTPPSEYSDRITLIPYKTLISNPDQILNTVSQIVNVPVPDSARSYYQNYITNQTNLINKYAPWLGNSQP
jgi:hypothetical protein